MMRALALGGVLVAVGCKPGAGRSDDPDLTVTAEPPKGSAGGFSASLGAELAIGSGGATGSGSGSASGSGSESASGSGSESASESASGSASESASGSASASGSGSASASGSASGSASASASGSESGSGSTGGTRTAGTATAGPVATTPLEVSAELAAIKLSLLPNWDRDAGEAGTISLFVNVQRTEQSELFKFYYGYEDPSAPSDREAYKKWLTDTKILTVQNDRQRGTAWLLEGLDASGGQAFRIVVLYGGKRLICYGSLYKRSPLGDFRDEVIIQARKICESISL